MITTIISVALFILQFPVADRVVPLDESDRLISTSWTVEDGLPVNSINSVTQDQKGYIWISTYDGIVRFDGVRFHIYNHSNTPEMPQNRAVLMLKQENGTIWVTLENQGIFRIKDHKIEHFSAEDGFTDSNVTYLIEDENGIAWFGAQDGLYKYRDGEFRRMIDRDSADKNNIGLIYGDDDGTVWASTIDGLVHVDGDDQTVYNKPDNPADNQIKRVFRTRYGELLVGTNDGLYSMGEDGLYMPERFDELEGMEILSIYADEQITLVSAVDGLYKVEDGLDLIKPYSRIREGFANILKTSDGKLWMVNLQGEINIYEDGEIVVLHEDDKFEGIYFNRIFEDREGNIWASTARSGIVRIKRSKVKTIGAPEGLTGDNILALFEDSCGRYWVGTRDWGLNMIKEDEVHHFNTELESQIVYSVAEDHAGNILVGFYREGLAKFSDDGIRNYDIGLKSEENNIRAIYVSRDSTVWLGTYGGLVQFDGDDENHTYYNQNDGLAGNLVRYIDEDEESGLWIATQDGGVSYFRDGEFINYTAEDGLSSNNIRSVYVDEYDPGTVWVGTETSGINRIQNGEITSVSTDGGLPDHIAHYISQDSFGWLWVSSNRGIFKLDKEELNEYLDGATDYYTIRHYGIEEGMRNPEANGTFRQGGLRTTDDTYWFSTQEGVAIFEIDEAVQNTAPPNVIIEGVKSGGREYEGQEVVLDPIDRNIQIDYYALTFVTPEKTTYRYRLNGYDEEWKEIKGSRSVNYADLSPGSYEFQLTASNNDGVWSEEQATLSITVSPMFYEQAWFYLLITALMVGGFLGISKMRYQYLMKRQEELEEKIQEQTKQIRKEKSEIEEQKKVIEKQAETLEESIKTKDKFLSIIAHDLRNPFQGLVGYSELLLTTFEDSDKKEQMEMLDKMKKSAESLYSLSENLLNWASLQTGKMEPYPESFQLDALIQKNIDIFKQSAEQKEITISSQVIADSPIKADKNMIDLVIRNLLSNAVKFTENGGEIVISLNRSGNHYRITVQDDGIGMSEKQLKSLMKVGSNNSKAGTNNERGTGLGLIICKDMIEKHSGTINIESTEGEGTTFTVVLPKLY